MGLSGPKQKQRLVGSASTRNTAWLNDSSAPGQRMLAQMGWSAGQSLGLTMPGLTENLKVAYKMDNKGIGSQRHEKEARANGKDMWVGGAGDLGSLFERLNAANAASSSSSAVASTSTSDAENDEKKSKKSKKDKKDRKDKKDKLASKDEGDKKSKKKRKHGDDAEEEASSDSKSKKSKKDKKAKESKKSKRSLEKAKADAVSTLASADPALAKDAAAVAEIKNDVVQGRPVRLAHRAKFLRAKRMVSANDLASVNEILGIASTPSSSAPASGTATPTVAPKTYPGPGGSEIPLMDVDRRLEAEQDIAAAAAAAASGSDSDSDSKSDNKGKKSKKDKKDKKKKDKEEKKKSKKSKTAAAVATKAVPALSAEEQAAAEEKERSTQIGTNSQGLYVFEYLNRKLMIRKAQIQKQKKAEQEAIFARAARVGA